MNESIKDFAKDARLLTGWPVGMVEYRKFAELIIKDVIEKAWDEIFREYDVPEADRVKERLMKHYGIEE